MTLVPAFATTGAPDEGFFHFLKHWLSSHICGVDTMYAALGVAAR